MLQCSAYRRWAASFHACLLACIATLAQPAPAQDIGNDESSVSEKAPVKPGLLFDLADVYGRYYFGDGLGVNCALNITADHRFTFTWSGCMGEYDRNSGPWELDGDIIVLKPEQPNESVGFQGVNTRFIPVKVGEVEFLIDEFEMPGFCASLAQKDEPFGRHGHDYVKSEDEQIDVQAAAPLIPERFKHFYGKGAIETAVVRVDDEGNAVLNKGSINRLAPGMRLEFNGFEASIELIVLTTTETEAVAKPQFYWNSDPKRQVQKGDEFTTGGYWHRPRGTGFERFDKVPNKNEK